MEIEKIVKFNSIPLKVIIPEDVNPKLIPNEVHYPKSIQKARFLLKRKNSSFKETKKNIMDLLKVHKEGLTVYDFVKLMGKKYPFGVYKALADLENRKKIWFRALGRGRFFIVYSWDHARKFRKMERETIKEAEEEMK